MNKNIINKIGFILSMIFFVIAVIILHKELRGYHYQDIIDSIRMTSHGRLYLAGVFTLLSLYFMTLYEMLKLDALYIIHL